MPLCVPSVSWQMIAFQNEMARTRGACFHTVRAPEDVAVATSPARRRPCTCLTKVVIEIPTDYHGTAKRPGRARVCAARGRVRAMRQLHQEDVCVEVAARSPLRAGIVHRPDAQCAGARHYVPRDHDVVRKVVIPTSCVESSSS